MISESLVFQNQVSNKFWNLQVNGKSFTVSWGRIGTVGQHQTKNFYSEKNCRGKAKKRIASKLKKGYVKTITEEIILEIFIMMISGVAKRKNNDEFYYRDDKFNKLATIEFVDGSDHIILRHYYENDNKKSEHEWVKGKQHGKDLGWKENGKKHWERKFVSGKLVHEKRY